MMNYKNDKTDDELMEEVDKMTMKKSDINKRTIKHHSDLMVGTVDEGY